MTVLNS